MSISGKILNFPNNIFLYVGYSLFFLMLTVPTQLREVKLILLVLICTAILIDCIYCRNGNIFLHKKIFMWTLFYSAIGSLFIFWGFINDAPGAIRVSTVYVIWPLTFTILIAGIKSEKMINSLMRIIVIANISICLYSLLWTLKTTGYLTIIPFDINIFDTVHQSVSIYEAGYSRYNSPWMAIILFSAPFIFAILCIRPKQNHSFFYWILWITTIINLSLVIISGKRILLLIILLLPILVLFFSYFLPGHQKRGIIKRTIGNYLIIFLILIVIYLIFGTLYEYNLGNMLKNLTLFDDSVRNIENVRYEQFEALINGWLQNPILGAGHGAAVDLVRSEKYRWAYELTYVALLYQVGLVGFMAYFAGVTWIFWMAIKIIKMSDRMAQHMIPVIVGSLCFLIANSTNPYLVTFDYIWVVFYPIGLINYWLVDHQQRVYKRDRI